MEQSKFYQIKNITEQEYTLVGCDGSVITRPIQDVDRLASAFTIQDAKDGDVLCDYSEEYNNPLIFILKKFEHVNFGLVKPSDYSSYCFLTAGDRQKFKEGSYHHKCNIKPATKEQRDFLFAKIKEAGYKWDAEKKELKKIETNPTWCEEDEEMIKGLNNCLSELEEKCGWRYTYVNNKDVELDKIRNWLKSLKDRYTWKPSEEQMEALWNVIPHIPNSEKDIDTITELSVLYEDLKKLREE